MHSIYNEKLYEIVRKYKNTYHGTIKVKPVNLKSSTFIDFNEENSKSHPKFKVRDDVKISKYKSIFAKVYVLNMSGVRRRFCD